MRLVTLLGGDLGWKHSIKDTEHEDPPEGMYGEVDDSWRDERGM